MTINKLGRVETRAFQVLDISDDLRSKIDEIIDILNAGGADPAAITQAVQDYLTANPPEAGVDEAAIQQIVEDYISSNPPSGTGLTPEQAAQIERASQDAATAIDLVEDKATAIDASFLPVPYLSTLNITYNEVQPNISVTGITGGLTLNMLNTAQGDSGMVILNGRVNEAITLNGTAPTEVYPPGKVSLTFIHEPSGIVWYCNNPLGTSGKLGIHQDDFEIAPNEVVEGFSVPIIRVKGLAALKTISIARTTGSPISISDIWSGTQAQYDAITTKNATTLYYIL